jgi:methyl-accepting chemotaxis protein
MFKDMKLGTRLGLGLGTIFCFSAVLPLISASMLSSVMGGVREKKRRHIAKNRYRQSKHPGSVRLRAGICLHRHLRRAHRRGVGAIGRAEAILASTLKQVNDNTALVEKRLVSNEEKTLLATVKDRRKAYGNSRNHVLELKKAGQSDQAVNQVTQQNAAQVEEAAAAAESLQDQAAEHANVVSVFKLGTSEQKTAADRPVLSRQPAQVKRLPVKAQPKAVAGAAQSKAVATIAQPAAKIKKLAVANGDE